jgi:hypothetical protein
MSHESTSFFLVEGSAWLIPARSVLHQTLIEAIPHCEMCGPDEEYNQSDMS